MTPTAVRSDIFTVSKLNKFAKHVLESEIGQIWLSGEISNFVAASSGHWYFTVKDERAQIKAAMFRNANRVLKQQPKAGDHVLIRGSVGLYETRGDYQLIADYIEPEGIGRLKQQFEALKQRLSIEGLFSQEHKVSLPETVNRLGIITSASGAALHDVLTVLKRRNPGMEIVLYPSMVQGNEAPNQLINVLRTAQSRNEVDVILITRGGGSLEDLWCFNDEQLARTIFSCNIPIVSAVGHEIDFTICDFVADLRAATPSAAAELLSKDSKEIQKRLSHLYTRLNGTIGRYLSSFSHRLELKQNQLKVVHPKNQIMQKWQQLDHSQLRLKSTIEDTLNRSKQRLNGRHNSLLQHTPNLKLQQAQQRLESLDFRLNNAWQLSEQSKREKLAHLSHVLNTVSPLATLGRGYSITKSNEKVLTDSSHVLIGDEIETLLEHGSITSVVSKTE